MKKFYVSKIFWVNIITLLWIITGDTAVVSDEVMIGALAVINVALRIITHEKLEW